jgi:branched-subunit amino acid ABC-type transport system permease component
MGDLLIASLADGLLLGFVYGIAAMGLSLIWGVMDVINLAHGPVIALGMLGIYFASTGLGLNPYLALILVAMGGLLLGILIYWGAVHRVIDAPHLSTLLATFAVNMIIIGIGTAIFTTSPRNVDFSLGSFFLGPITIGWTRIAAAGLAALVTALLYLFLHRTRPGKAIRAVTDNRAAAELMGIPTSWILALSFGFRWTDRHLFPFYHSGWRFLRTEEFCDLRLGRTGESSGRTHWRSAPWSTGGHYSCLH